MKKITFSIVIIVILLFPLNVLAITYPDINSKKAIVYDMTDDKILYEKDIDSVSSIASLTKIMTTIVAIENIDDLGKTITITDEMLSLVRWDASVAGLQVGDKVTYKDLLYASILPSGADATIALAISTSGSVQSFTDKMNAKAKEIGLANTHYVNITGLDEDDHYSTVADILTLLKYALHNPLFKEIYTTKSYTLSNNLEVYSTINMYNRTMGLDTKRILGSKTGYTLNAGYCISALMNSDEHDILIILLDAENINNVFYNIADTLELIDFIDSNYNTINLFEKDTVVKTLAIKNGKKDTYEVKVSDTIEYFLPLDYLSDSIKVKYDGIEVLSSKNKIGDELGTLSYYVDGELIRKDKVYLEENIDFSLSKYFKTNKKVIITIVCVFLLIVLYFHFKKKKRNRRLKLKIRKH